MWEIMVALAIVFVVGFIYFFVWAMCVAAARGDAMLEAERRQLLEQQAILLRVDLQTSPKEDTRITSDHR